MFTNHHRQHPKGQLYVENFKSSYPNDSQLDAVIIRNLTYIAGKGIGKKVILNKINLTVPEGSM